MSGAIYVLNGPNLNLLGEREPEIYGRETLADLEARCAARAKTHGLELVFRQTNREYEMIDWIQAARASAGLVINPAAFCYQSVPVLDALKTCSCPIVEVHISNIHARLPAWRANTILAAAATGLICGLGLAGYELAIDYVAGLAANTGR